MIYLYLLNPFCDQVSQHGEEIKEEKRRHWSEIGICKIRQ